MRFKLTQWTINARSMTGVTYPLYFETETREQAEWLVFDLAIQTDTAGICEMVEEVEDED